ncbi:MAG: NAD-dependent epimerase/dehydratase family protein [Methanobacteriaceae archaeon]|nr:NAD-dependent epimerase/dehydratase family protein [Methanobacteriaceae archaeon]
MKGEKVVVTGGTGFIGSHIAEKLVENGNFVTIIDDMSSGKLENIKHLDENKIDIIRGNIRDLGLKKIFEDHSYVFHEAAIASVPHCIEHPTKANEINLTGSMLLLKAACKAGVKKVISASSSAVYGNTNMLPNKETLPLTPISPYAVTKASMELYSYAFSQTYNLPTTCLRYFNVFGPRQNAESEYSAVIPKFITSLLNDNRPIIYGDGEQTRDFISVENIAYANIQVAESAAKGVFNIASGEKTSINELLMMICDITGYEFNPIYKNPQIGDIKHSVADVSKAKEDFGFEVKNNFKNELKKTIDYFINLFDSNNE